MARFLHLTDARLANRIRRSGLRPPSGSRGDGSIYCVPVTSDFFSTFQWSREMRRAGYRSSIAVMFVIPDAEIVMVGRYSDPGETMTAANAVAHFSRGPMTLGHQVRIERKIQPSEIRSIRHAPLLAGWRFDPDAKGREVFWVPPGTMKAGRARARIEKKFG